MVPAAAQHAVRECKRLRTIQAPEPLNPNPNPIGSSDALQWLSPESGPLVSVCLSVRPSVCPSVCLSVCLHQTPRLPCRCLSVCIELPDSLAGDGERRGSRDIGAPRCSLVLSPMLGLSRRFSWPSALLPLDSPAFCLLPLGSPATCCAILGQRHS
jgi:hypothetical protein